MSERISVDIQDGVADVRLTRSDKMNAPDDQMFKALIDTGERMKTETGRSRRRAFWRRSRLLRRFGHGQFRQDGRKRR